MSRKSKKKYQKQITENKAKNSGAPQNFSSKSPTSPPHRGSAEDSASQVLQPIRPDPRMGFQPLSKPLVECITKATMARMTQLSRERHIPLDLKYWERVTRAILGQKSTDTAIIVPAPAGSGKSTWILAFMLAMKDLFQEKPELEKSLVGITVVLQKVDDLNELAEVLNQGCPQNEPFMVPLQGWSKSGKQRGFCQCAGVDSYAECPRNQCPYALQCPILTFHEKVLYAPVVGLTQARFCLLRQGDLDSVLQRLGPDGTSYPRRYILFDEKYPMVPIAELNMERINETSTAFNTIIEKYHASDTRVCGLQQQLNYSITRIFQKIRRVQQTAAGNDIQIGFLSFSEEEREDSHVYYEFRNSFTTYQKRFMTEQLTEMFSVIDYLYEGGICLFTKIRGFCIYRIDRPQIHFGDSQTIIFDATAEVDNDYRNLDNVEIISGTPESTPREIILYVHGNSAMNVSKSAMDTPWKLPALAEYTAKLVQEADRPSFLCTYKEVAVELAGRLKAQLPSPVFDKVLLMPDREVPTLPYFNGTNGSNHFKDAELAIMLGYPRLNATTYLAFTCAACGLPRIRAELAEIPEEQLTDRDFDVRNLPSVRDYMTHHLAARLEQEIYRSVQRDPGFTGKIEIHLFYPPQDVLNILQERIHGHIIYDDALPDCVARHRGAARRYEGGSTSFGRLVHFLDTWDGSPPHVAQIQEQLEISPAVWKDLIADPRVQALWQEYGIVRSGRGPNAIWEIPGQKCA